MTTGFCNIFGVTFNIESWICESTHTKTYGGGDLWVINFDSYHAICLDIEMPCKMYDHKFTYAYEMEFI